MGKPKHESHFIPSPFKVVTEYEDEFIKEWKKNTDNALTEVVKFIADLVTNENKKLEQ